MSGAALLVPGRAAAVHGPGPARRAHALHVRAEHHQRGRGPRRRRAGQRPRRAKPALFTEYIGVFTVPVYLSVFLGTPLHAHNPKRQSNLKL